MRAIVVVAGMIGLALAGCARIPELDAHLSPEIAAADYPDLVPIETLRRISEPDPEAGKTETERLQGRVGALQARADRMRRGDVLDPASRRRLDDKVAQVD